VAPSVIHLDRRIIRPHCALEPDFAHPAVLSADPWAFVTLWLRRERQQEAGFYWQQARELFEATQPLPAVTSPITAYYSCLNAAKALLSVRRFPFAVYHGAAGATESGRVALANETIKVHASGVIPALSQLLGYWPCEGTYSLYDLLRVLPFVHRAFTLTYKSAGELFIPLNNPCFVCKPDSDKAWFQAEVPPRYQTNRLASTLPAGFEVDHGQRESGVVRRKKRFEWAMRNLGRAQSIKNLVAYHRDVRDKVHPIVAAGTRWYLERKQLAQVNHPACKLVCMFAALHRLSELSRYHPLVLKRHLDARHGWLLVEFLQTAPIQFIYTVASELTHTVFLSPMSLRIPRSRSV
jgi:hypothetical protein